MTRRALGFSLIEMAFVLIIVTLLLGGLLVPFATQVEQKRIAETNKALEEIREALIGYALAHGNAGAPNLPCPDTDNNGTEDFTLNGACTNAEGNLPWATLGVGMQDAWGNRFHYRVTAAFADRVPAPAPGFTLNDSGDIDVCTVAPAVGAVACALNKSLATDVPAVVVSFGKNGYGALNLNSAGGRNIAPTSLDELANQSGDNIFVSHTLILPGVGNTEFDDQVTWLSSNILFNRMVAAGRLP